MMDEVWQYNEGVVEKAKARTTAFGNTKKIIISSQPGIEGDQLDKEHTGKLFEWQWKCPHCNAYQSYNWNIQKSDDSWAGMIWEKQYIDATSGSYDIERTAATAKLQCSRIGAGQGTRSASIDAGQRHQPAGRHAHSAGAATGAAATGARRRNRADRPARIPGTAAVAAGPAQPLRLDVDADPVARAADRVVAGIRVERTLVGAVELSGGGHARCRQGRLQPARNCVEQGRVGRIDAVV